MFFNSTFEEEELEKEKNVVYEEIKMYEDTPDDIVHDLLSKAIYENHSLGLSNIRYRRNLSNISLENTLKNICT